jgi:hypothetical protein
MKHGAEHGPHLLEAFGDGMSLTFPSIADYTDVPGLDLHPRRSPGRNGT